VTTLLYQVVSAAVAVLVLIVWVRPQSFRFLLDKGSAFPSLGRQGQYTAMVISTWVLVTVTLVKKGDVQEWLFIGYMFAWGGAQFGSLWLKVKGQGHAGSSSSTEIIKTENRSVGTP